MWCLTPDGATTWFTPKHAAQKYRFTEVCKAFYEQLNPHLFPKADKAELIESAKAVPAPESNNNPLNALAIMAEAAKPAPMLT